MAQAELAQRLGFCVICGQRVFTDDSYLKSREGYVHRSCVTDAPITA